MRRAMKAYGPGGTLFILAPAIVVLFCAPWALLAQTAGPQLPNPGNPSIGRDQQQKLGLQAAAEVYKQMPVLPDSSPETQYIRQVGKRLVATIPAQYSWPFDFHVVAQKEINAFALPGGEMFVNIGTITAAANEAQLLGVMSTKCRMYTCSIQQSKYRRRSSRRGWQDSPGRSWEPKAACWERWGNRVFRSARACSFSNTRGPMKLRPTR